MKKKKIKNPLIRRIPRELLGDWKKYLVVALFLILTIGFVSGMYVLLSRQEQKRTSKSIILTKRKKSWTKSWMKRLIRKPMTRHGIKS